MRDPWVRKIPWRRKWQPTSVLLPGESPWTEEPGGLQPMGSQRVATNTFTISAVYSQKTHSFPKCFPKPRSDCHDRGHFESPWRVGNPQRQKVAGRAARGCVWSGPDLSRQPGDSAHHQAAKVRAALGGPWRRHLLSAVTPGGGSRRGVWPQRGRSGA